MIRRYVCLAVIVVIPLLVATPATAQSVDAAGVRARGMDGAFTAVADDASATWWNPAGLAAGAYLNAVFEWDRPDTPPGSLAAEQTSVSAFAAAFPALGLSYYRFHISEIRRSPPTGSAVPSRQDLGPAGEGLPTLAASQFGATVGQSLGDHLVLGTTVKWLRGGPEGEAATNAASLDLGAMATFGRLRLGLAVRNVTEPTLGANEAFTLSREARAGAAVTLGPASTGMSMTLAGDASLTTSRLGAGKERPAAGGIEVWLFKRRLGVRGGVAVQTVGDLRPSGSGGASVGLRTGVYVEGAITRGDDWNRRGWTVGARVTF